MTDATATRLHRLVATDAHEGPVHAADEDALYFTTGRPLVSIMRLHLATGRVDVVRADANMANGMALDREGRLVICEQGDSERPAAITRMDRATGAVETVADAYRGRPLNSPNDVVVARDGAIWFTDPAYGHVQGFRPEPVLGEHVYRCDAAGVEIVAGGFDKPNGLALSPGEDVLYVTDSGAPHHVVALDLAGGARRVLHVTRSGSPDGINVDAAGRVYASAATGVDVLSPGGRLVDEIPLPGAVNFCFGPDVLFITTDDAVWSAPTKGA